MGIRDLFSKACARWWNSFLFTMVVHHTVCIFSNTVIQCFVLNHQPGHYPPNIIGFGMIYVKYDRNSPLNLYHLFCFYFLTSKGIHD